MSHNSQENNVGVFLILFCSVLICICMCVFSMDLNKKVLNDILNKHIYKNKLLLYSIYAYVGLIIIYNVITSYMTGIVALSEYRKNHLNSEYYDEFSLIKSAISVTFFKRLYDSIFLPITFFDSIIPMIILFFNKR